MKRRPRHVSASLLLLLPVVFLAAAATDGAYTTTVVKQQPSTAAEQGAKTLPTIAEAREQAKLLHETLHSSLQIVHHRYYREDEGLPIPAFTLKTVFEEVEQRTSVKLHWLVVEGEAMNVGHIARDEFEKKAVAALKDNQPFFEAAAEDVYRHVGPITLGNECLKCHVPNRTTTDERKAGLVITIPVRNE